MRIISGSAKGRTLKAPRGGDTRPTTDLVRSAMFSMLESMQADLSRVLDLYAGSGALGLESLSRGADWADFVEQDRRACSVIKENLEDMGFSDRAHVYCGKVSKALAYLEGPYGVVFLDPPYADPALPSILESLAASALVDERSILAVSQSSRVQLPQTFGQFHSVRERRHGDTQISLFAWEAAG